MGLYRLQVSQHQLQKDVTHQFSRFLVNRCDDETDLSNIVQYTYSSVAGFSVMASSFHRCKTQCALPVVRWGKQTGQRSERWPAAYDLWTKCPKVFLKGGSAAPALVGLS